MACQAILRRPSDFPFRSLPRANIVGRYATKSMTRNFYLSRAFTFIELLVVIVVLGILFTIAYPAFIGTQERAKVTKDMSNLRQIGLATQTYMNDNDGVLPGSATRDTVDVATGTESKILVRVGRFTIAFRHALPLGNRTMAPVSPISYGINANVYPGGSQYPLTELPSLQLLFFLLPRKRLEPVSLFPGLLPLPFQA